MLFDVENTARLVMLVLYVIKVCADRQGSVKLCIFRGGGVGGQSFTKIQNTSLLLFFY